MNRISRLATTVLVCGGLGLAGFGLAAGTAQADPVAHQWCPGQRLPDDGTNPDGTPHVFTWDMNVCHTYYVVGYRHGNVGDYIWADSPPPPQPPPAIPPLWVP